MIRAMTPEELPKIIPGAYSFFREANLPGQFDAEHCIRTWERFLQTDVGVLGWQAAAQSQAIDAIGGVIYPNAFTGQLHAMEMFWYVLPGQRSIGLKLLRWFEGQALARGARRIIMVCLHNLNRDKIGAFYQRIGYAPLE